MAMDRERRLVLLLLLVLEVVIVVAVLIGIRSTEQPGSAEPNVEHQASNLSQVFQTGEKPHTDGKTSQNHHLPAANPHRPTNSSGDSIVTPALPSTAAGGHEVSPHLTPTPRPSATLPSKKSDLTPEVAADRTLKAAAVLLILIAVVTTVGLMHFKVCKEMKRVCQDVKGPSRANTPRSVRRGYVHKLMLVLHKPQLLLRGLFGRHGEVDRVHCTTGPLLHPFSQVMTDPVGKSGVVYIEQEYV